MPKVPQYILTEEQANLLKATLQSLQEDVSFLEKTTGKILIKADQEKCEDLIRFCHDIFQSLRLIPIYTRNIEKMIALDITGKLNAYAEKTNTLLNGLLCIAEQAFSVDNKHDPENLHAIISQLVSQEEYLNFGVTSDITKMRMVAVKLDQTFLKLKSVLN